MSPVNFYVEGPTGEEAYEQANEIAEQLENYIDTMNQAVVMLTRKKEHVARIISTRSTS